VEGGEALMIEEIGAVEDLEDIGGIGISVMIGQPIDHKDLLGE
jgi:Cu/Ag efflux pump CusA